MLHYSHLAEHTARGREAINGAKEKSRVCLQQMLPPSILSKCLLRISPHVLHLLLVCTWSFDWKTDIPGRSQKVQIFDNS